MKTLLTIIALIFTSLIFAQNVDVYFAKGQVVVKNNGTTTKISQSSVLQVNDVLVLKEGATVILLKSEKAVVLKKQGEYSFQEIQEKFEASKQSITDKYIQYIWQKAHDQKKTNDDEGNGNMNVTGMVTRGEGGILFPSDSSIIISNAVKIKVKKDYLPCQLVFYKKQRPLMSISSNQTEVQVENLGLIDKSSWFGLAVKKENGAPSAQIVYVKWANDADKKIANDKIRELLTEISDLPQEVQNDLIAAFYEVNHYVNLQTQ